MIVLACPACSRQYDVTHTEAGSRVRCVCGESFTVRIPAELRVIALVCSHCGGAVGADDAACPYCEAALSARDRRESMLCPSCNARIATDSRHCRACGTAIEPQALTPIPDGRRCPRCEGELGLLDLGHASVVDCEACGGMWLATQTFESLCRRARNDAHVLAEQRTVVPPKERKLEPVRYIPCLTCGQLMNRRQFTWQKRFSGVVVDLCRDHGIWLDADELQEIVEFLRTRGNIAEGGARGEPEFLSETDLTRRRGVDPAAFLGGQATSREHPFERAIEFLVELVFGGFSR